MTTLQDKFTELSVLINALSDDIALGRNARPTFTHISKVMTEISMELEPAGAWVAPTGTLDRTTFATGSVTLSELAERVAALITDLTAKGVIGP